MWNRCDQEPYPGLDYVAVIVWSCPGCNLWLLCCFVWPRRVQQPPCGTSTRAWPQLCPSSCVSSSASSWSPRRPPNSSQDQHTRCLMCCNGLFWVVVKCVMLHCSTEGTTAQGSVWTWGRWSPTSPVSSVKTRSGCGGPNPARESTRSVWLWTTPPAWWTTTPNRLESPVMWP